MTTTERRPIHVLHVTAVTTSNYYLNNLVDHTRADAVRFFAVTLGPEGGFVDDLRKRGVYVEALDCGRRSRYAKALGAIRRLISREAIDIVHGHLFDPTVLAVTAAKWMDCRLTTTRHHSDAVHTLPSWSRRRFYGSLERWINRSADHLIAPSRVVFEMLTQREGVPAGKVSLIPYGQTFERFGAISSHEIAAARRDLGMAGRFAVVCVSRLHPEKGHAYLLDAFAAFSREVPVAILYLVGEGPERSALERRVSDLGLEERVRFLGWRDDALAVLAASDMVIHPSLHEALPSAVIEAAMLEKPIVATDVSGVRDILGDDRPHGLVVPPRNSAELLDGLRAVHADPAGARHRAGGARERVLRTMDARRTAEAYTECYRKVLRRKP